jgi:hypothetical protein
LRRADDEKGEEDAPELPDDGIPLIFEGICDFYLEITTVVVVCG